MISQDIQKVRLRQRAAFTSVSVGVFLLVVKLAAYYLTGSNAILSDALESIVNVVASGFALFAILRSSRPPDRSYPYGYGKIELFSAGFEGALVIIAALGILWISIPSFFEPQPLTQLDIGLALILFSGGINYLLGLYLMRTGRNARSDALIADGHHVQSDSYTTFGVIVGLALAWLTGWAWLDPLIACLVSLNLLRIGAKIMFSSSTGLLDKTDPEFMTKLVEGLQTLRQPGWIAPHRLRSWRSGALRYIDMHLVVPSWWEISTVHQTQNEIEARLFETLDEQGQIIIHVDPCMPDYCSMCTVQACPIRTEPHTEELHWTEEALSAGPPHPLRYTEMG